MSAAEGNAVTSSSRGKEDGSVVSIAESADGGSSTRAAEVVPTIDADASCADASNGASKDAGVVESAKQQPAATPAATAAAAATPTATAEAPSAAVAQTRNATAEAEERLSPAEPPRLWLEAVAGCLKGRSWMIEAAGATLGRASDNTLSLADKEMSRRHSKVKN